MGNPVRPSISQLTLVSVGTERIGSNTDSLEKDLIRITLGSTCCEL